MTEDTQHLKQTAADHRRIAILTVLLAFIVTVFACYAAVVESREAEQRVATADYARTAAMLDKRIAAIESERAEDRSELESRLQILAASREAMSSSSVTAGGTPSQLSEALSSVVEIVCIDNVKKTQVYAGSGTVIDSSGLIVTNRHLIVSEDGSLIRYCGIGFTSNISESPKLNHIAGVVALHRTADLALLRIDERLDGEPLQEEGFSAVALKGAGENANDLQLGDAIFIAGYPGIGSETFTFTQGVVSGRVGDGLIKTSALVDSGTSGGAGFDGDGNYIGVPSAAAKGDIGGSMGYLIPAGVVERFVDDYFALRTDLPEPTMP